MPPTCLQERGLQLISSSQWEGLTRLLNYADLFPLRPLLLLLGWDRNPDVGSGKELLDALWPSVKGEVGTHTHCTRNDVMCRGTKYFVCV